MLITKLIFVALAVSLLVFALWRESRLLRATIAEHQYWGAVAQVLIFLSFDFLTVVFLSYLLGALRPTLGALSQPKYVRVGFTGILLGVTVAGIGQAIEEARRGLMERKPLRVSASLALGVAGLAGVVVVYMKFLRH